MNERSDFMEAVWAFRRELDATFWLGPKGQHFDGDEWERRADAIQGRVRWAESLVEPLGPVGNEQGTA